MLKWVKNFGSVVNGYDTLDVGLTLGSDHLEPSCSKAN